MLIFHGDQNIPETTDKIYAKGKTTGIKSRIVQKETNSCRKNKPQMDTGQRKSWRLRWKDPIPRARSQIYWRTQKSKAGAKEKELLNSLKQLMDGAERTIQMLK